MATTNTAPTSPADQAPATDRGALLEAPPAALWRRAVARALDAATVFFTLWMLAVLRILWFVDELADRVHPEPWGRAFTITLLFGVVWMIYEAVFLRYSDGQTPGRDFLDVRVVRLTDGNDPSPLRAAGRSLLPGVLPVLVWPVLDWAAAAFVLATMLGATALIDTRRRTTHDRLAGTAVVHHRHDGDEGGETGSDADALDLDDPSPDGKTVVAELLFGRSRRKPRR